MEAPNENPVTGNKVSATTKTKKTKKRPVNRTENLHLVCPLTINHVLCI